MHDDKLLVQQFRDGDSNAFDVIVEKYQQKVYNIAFRMLGNPEDASDVAQESFVKMYRSLRYFKGDSSLSTWIYRVCTNLCIDFVRKNRKGQKVVSLDTPVEPDGRCIQIADPDQSPEQSAETKELRKVIEQALDTLKTQYKTVIILRDVQNFSYQDIAKILNCSLGTVKSRISRARYALKEKLLKDQAFGELFRKKIV